MCLCLSSDPVSNGHPGGGYWGLEGGEVGPWVGCSPINASDVTPCLGLSIMRGNCHKPKLARDIPRRLRAEREPDRIAGKEGNNASTKLLGLPNYMEIAVS